MNLNNKILGGRNVSEGENIFSALGEKKMKAGYKAAVCELSR